MSRSRSSRILGLLVLAGALVACGRPGLPGGGGGGHDRATGRGAGPRPQRLPRQPDAAGRVERPHRGHRRRRRRVPRHPRRRPRGHQPRQHGRWCRPATSIGASPLLSALFHDEPTVEAMNEIGLDVNAVGNHEFDEGTDELLRLQEGGCHPVDGCLDGDDFAGADFEFLAANVVSEATGRPAVPRRTRSSASRPNTKVAFIGMTLEGTPTIVTPEGVAGFDFLDEADTANAWSSSTSSARASTTSSCCCTRAASTTGGGYNGCTGITGPIVDIVEPPRRPGRRGDQRPHPPGLQLRDRRQAGHQRRVVRPPGHRHGPDASTGGPRTSRRSR